MVSPTLPLGRIIIVKPNWTCFYCLVKNLKSEKTQWDKKRPNIREKSTVHFNVHIAPPKMNNLILATCYTDTYANQNLYTNLVNNFARFGVSVYVSLT